MGGGPHVTIHRVVRPGLEAGLRGQGEAAILVSVVGLVSSIEFRLIRLVPFFAHGHLACEDRPFHRAGAEHRPDPSEKSPRLGALSDTAARAAFSPVRTAPDHRTTAIDAMARARTPAAPGEQHVADLRQAPRRMWGSR